MKTEIVKGDDLIDYDGNSISTTVTSPASISGKTLGNIHLLHIIASNICPDVKRCLLKRPTFPVLESINAKTSHCQGHYASVLFQSMHTMQTNRIHQFEFIICTLYSLCSSSIETIDFVTHSQLDIPIGLQMQFKSNYSDTKVYVKFIDLQNFCYFQLFFRAFAKQTWIRFAFKRL